MEKVMIVEGKTDKAVIREILREPVELLCTYGTAGVEQLEELGEAYYDCDVYIFVDSDYSGAKLRKQLRQIFPHAWHLYVDRVYGEVATAPKEHLAKKLANAFFEVDETLLVEKKKMRDKNTFS